MTLWDILLPMSSIKVYILRSVKPLSVSNTELFAKARVHFTFEHPYAHVRQIIMYDK